MRALAFCLALLAAPIALADDADPAPKSEWVHQDLKDPFAASRDAKKPAERPATTQPAAEPKKDDTFKMNDIREVF
jgi:hypothetical protein